MKIALIADTQFDEFSSLSTLTPSGVTTRLKDQIEALRWVGKDAIARGCKRLLILGDIFDSRTDLNLSVIDQVCRTFHDLHEAGLELHFLPGNHDSYLRSPLINSLQMFRGYATVHDVPTVTKDGYAFMPWVEDRETLVNSVAALKAQGGKYLFMHGIIDGAVHKSVKGITLEEIIAPKWEQVWLGDVHSPIKMATNVEYVGSFMQLEFGDAGGWRGYVVLDDVTGKFERVENEVSPRFHVLREGSLTSQIKRGDFVSVQAEDPTLAEELTIKARAATNFVRSVHVEVAEVKPRLAVRTTQEDDDLLTRYATHVGIDNPELVRVGVAILKRARA